MADNQVTRYIMRLVRIFIFESISYVLKKMSLYSYDLYELKACISHAESRQFMYYVHLLIILF